MLNQSLPSNPSATEAKNNSYPISAPFNFLDKIIQMTLAVVVALYAVFMAKYHQLPFEDAAMLMRYSQNVAQGHGIVFNIGQAPVDGATDFLFMAVLAAVSKTGLSLENSVYVLGLVCHLLTTLLMYETIRRVAGASRWMASVSALFLALGPGLDYVNMGFGTPFFAVFAALTWRFALCIAQQEMPSSGSAVAFAFSGLLLGLVRPEGVLLALFMLFGLLYFRGLSHARPAVLAFLGIFGILGGAFFLWRWHYFGYPLPNPFYKKGGGHFYLSGLHESLHYVLLMNSVFLLGLLAGLGFKETRRRALFALIPITGFTAVWVLLSNEMNHAGRFQYALYPVVLMSWPFVYAQGLQSPRVPVWKSLNKKIQAATAIPFAAVLLLSLGYQHQQLHHEALLRSYHDMNYDVALALKPYSSNDYTIATTEGGIVPLYSHWQAIDLWGLNDQWIAHHTYVSAAYLDRFRPEVIEIHGPPALMPQDMKGRPIRDIPQQWLVMVGLLNQYVKDRHYVVARRFDDTSFRSHYSTGFTYAYYVRPDFPQSREIANRLRTLSFPPAWDPFIKSNISPSNQK